MRYCFTWINVSCLEWLKFAVHFCYSILLCHCFIPRSDLIKHICNQRHSSHDHSIFLNSVAKLTLSFSLNGNVWFEDLVNTSMKSNDQSEVSLLTHFVKAVREGSPLQIFPDWWDSCGCCSVLAFLCLCLSHKSVQRGS